MPQRGKIGTRTYKSFCAPDLESAHWQPCSVPGYERRLRKIFMKALPKSRVRGLCLRDRGHTCLKGSTAQWNHRMQIKSLMIYFIIPNTLRKAKSTITIALLHYSWFGKEKRTRELKSEEGKKGSKVMGTW